LLLTRLAYAVAYNFLQIAGINKCAFFVVMGPLDSLKILGQSFNKFVFPAALFLMVVLTATNCWSRILNAAGLKQYGFDDDYSESQTD
jgi:hypothetical protein